MCPPVCSPGTVFHSRRNIMNLSFKKLTEIFPHLNRKIFGETDFYRICRKEKITVAEIALKQNIFGYYSVFRGRAYIILDSNLSGINRLSVAFHELGHHYLHAPMPKSFFFNSQKLSTKEEAEAQAFALTALFPISLLKEIEEDPSLIEDYPQNLIEQRIELFNRFGI